MNYMNSKYDEYRRTPNSLSIKNQFDTKLEFALQRDGRLHVDLNVSGCPIGLRLNRIEVQLLKDLLK